MKIWESGRATPHIEDIKAGLKTVEGRLFRDKFAKYRVGDQIHLREDVYDMNGKLLREIPDQVRVEITKLEQFPTFKRMLDQVGFKKFLPRAKSLEEAVNEYKKFYDSEDEAKYSVIAIHIKLLK